MTTTNEMIYKTLRTKTSKPAKFADELRGMGYEVTNAYKKSNGDEYEREYWAVNGLEVDKYGGETAQLALGRGQWIERFDNIKLIDFVDYFEKRDARNEKRELMDAHDSIRQRRMYRVRRVTEYVDADGNVSPWYRHNSKPRKRRVRDRYYENENLTVTEYKTLKRKSEARGTWFRDREDAEIESAKRWLADAEAKVDKLWKELERAEREVEECKARVEKEIARKAEGQSELDAWLKARGIR